MKFDIIVAYNMNNGIGYKNNLLYRLKHDMKYFKEITTKVEDETKKNAVIMGRKTYDSIPSKFKPLPNRLNIVLTRNKDYNNSFDDNLEITNSFEKALEIANKNEYIENIFVIGGGEIYNTALQHESCSKIYVTKIFDSKLADTFFPKLDEISKLLSVSSLQEEKIDESDSIKYKYLIFEKK